jgi:hypothetical protein
VRLVDYDLFTCFGFVLFNESLIELLVELAGRIVGNRRMGSPNPALGRRERTARNRLRIKIMRGWKDNSTGIVCLEKHTNQVE